MGLGTSITTAVSEKTAVVIEDYMFDASVVGELTPEASPSDFHDAWDLDGTDFMPEASPDDEGYWDDFENVVTNGTFDADSDWSKGTGWTISGGKASFDASAASTFSYLTQASILSSPLDYELTFTLSDLGGSFSYSNAGIVRNGAVTSFSTLGLSAPGTHTVIVTETSGSNFLFFGHPNSDDFSIDNVSVTEYAIQPLDV